LILKEGLQCIHKKVTPHMERLQLARRFPLARRLVQGSHPPHLVATKARCIKAGLLAHSKNKC